MAASNYPKRIRVGSDDLETECQKCSNIVSESITCSGCKLGYCLKCAKISETLYKCIQSGEMDQFMWSCISCRATFTSLENIASALTDLRKSNDDRIGELENRVKEIEEGKCQDTQTSVSSMKEDVIKSLKEDAEKLVDSITKELDERRKRDFNVLVFNMPEHRYQSPEENKKADEDDVMILSRHIGLENLQLVAWFSLGKLTSNRCRPIKVVLQSKADRKYLLDNANYIQVKAPESMKRVIIVKDLTPVQRQERRTRLVDRRMRAQTEEEQNRETNPICDNQSIAMEVNEVLSPILPVSYLMSSTHLSQVNQYAASQPTRELSAIYEDTTSIEKTIIGGLSQGNTLKEPTSPDINDR